MKYSKSIAILTLVAYFIQACSVGGGPSAPGESGEQERIAADGEGVYVDLDRTDAPGESEVTEQVDLSKFSTRDLIRGLVFFDGPVAEAIPAIRDNVTMASSAGDNLKALAASRSLVNRILDQLEKTKPGEFEAFRADVLSGDHLKIQNALKRMTAAAAREYAATPEAKAAQENGAGLESADRGESIFAALVAVLAVAVLVWEAAGVAVHVAVAVNLAVVIAIETWTEVHDGAQIQTYNGKKDCLTDCNPPGRDDGVTNFALMQSQVVQGIAQVRVPVWRFHERSDGTGLEVSKFGGATVGRYALVFGEFDGDGTLDRMYYMPDGDVAVFFLTRHTRTGAGAIPWQLLYTAKSAPFVGDFNGDGVDDILWRRYSGSHQIWYNGNGPNSIGVRGIKYKSHAESSNWLTAVGDFNGDGRADVLWYGKGSASDDVWFGQSDATFTDGHAPSLTATNLQPITGDFLGDTRTDILFYTPGATESPLWIGKTTAATKGTTLSQDVATMRNPTAASSYSPRMGDFDGNGWHDLYWYTGLTTATNDDLIYMFFGPPRFALPGNAYQLAGAGQATGFSPNLRDLDRDGKTEITWWPKAGRILPSP